MAAFGRFEVWKVFICEAPQPKYTGFGCSKQAPQRSAKAALPALCWCLWGSRCELCRKTEERSRSPLSLQAELLHCVIEADVKKKNIQADTEMGENVAKQ